MFIRRQFQPEHAAATRVVEVTDSSSHKLHEPRRDGQAQTRAFDPAVCVSVEPLERLKQLVAVPEPDPWTGVDHFQAYACSAFRLSDPHFDRASQREFDGVAEQIDQHLPYSRGICKQATRHRWGWTQGEALRVGGGTNNVETRAD